MSVFGSGDYNQKKKVQLSVWRVVLLRQFWVLAITTGKKSSSRLSGGLCYDRKKKSSSRRQSDYDRKKKVQVVIKFVLVQLE